jgi:hypothetical protein
MAAAGVGHAAHTASCCGISPASCVRGSSRCMRSAVMSRSGVVADRTMRLC